MSLSLRKMLLPAFALLAFKQVSAQGSGFEWAKHAGGTSYDQGNAIAVDKDRNVYVAGYFNETADFGTGNTISAHGGSDMFVAKLDGTGATLWVKHFGGTGGDAALALKLDTLNNIYITGYFSDTVDFNPGGAAYTLTAAAGGSDVFVAKLDNSGNVVWARAMEGNGGSDEGRALALDAAGNVHTTGVFYGTVDFDPGTGSYPLTGTLSEIFVSKLDNNGNFVWARKMGGARLDSGEGIGVDAAGNVYTTGSFQRTADFDPGNGIFNLISGANSYDVFVSKLDASGAFVWARQLTGSSPNMGNGLALDTAANIYLTGMFTGTADFDPGSGSYELTAIGGTDVYIAKLDRDGAFVWAKQIGSNQQSGGDRGYSIAVDAWGNSYSTGFFSGTADFDPDPVASHILVSGGSSDIYVTKLDAQGGFRWARQLAAASGTNWGTGVAVDGSGNVYTTGLFTGTVDFDPGTASYPLTVYGNTDVFIHKLVCTDTNVVQLSVTAGCHGYTLGDTLFTDAGSYTVVLPNRWGCDSTISLDLSISLPEAVISRNGSALGTTQPFGAYQWYRNDTLLNGATGSSYIPNRNGSYKVVVTDSFGCTDTSEVYLVSDVTSVGSPYVQAQQVTLYPNPAADYVYVRSPVAVTLVLSAVEGRMLRQAVNARELYTGDLAKGIYLIAVKDKDGRLIKTEKLLKQ